jgi:hypothetical protein
MDKNLVFSTFDPRRLTLDLDFWPSTSTFDPRLMTLDPRPLPKLIIKTHTSIFRFSYEINILQ